MAVLLLLAAGVGCGGGGDGKPSILVPMDAGALPTDMFVVQRLDQSAAETRAKDVPAMDVPVADGGDAADGKSSAPIITVEILKPVALPLADGGAGAAPILPKTLKLAPEVRVVVVSQTDNATDDALEKVSASVTPVKGTTPSMSANLTLLQYERTPEDRTAIYIYANQPLDLAALASGEYVLSVQAKTVGGAVQSATMPIFIDAGPIITILDPAADAYVKGSLLTTVLVTDAFSGVKSVGFSIGQTPIKTETIVANGDRYSATIDLNGFPVPLDGPQILTVTAVNGNGNQSAMAQRFVIDIQGPSITGTLPVVGGLIGKIITIQATVSDSAGVVDSSVVAVMAHGPSNFQVTLEKSKDGKTYSKLFDTTLLPDNALYPTISFRAQDVLGNQSVVGYDLSLDNKPPIIDLDPPEKYQLFKKGAEGSYLCSWPFDPVGPDAIDDGQVVSQLFDIRARIEDEGNAPLTGTADFIPISGVEPTSVKLLILDDTSRPLVVNTSDAPNDDCDAINPELVPTSAPQNAKDAQVLGMVSLPANTGSGDFSPMSGVACSGSEQRPKAFCPTAKNLEKQRELTYLIGYAGKLPSIWTIAPIVNDDLQCAGRQFDASNHLSDGWACVAVSASDTLGNTQVSRPLRICVERTADTDACSSAKLGGADIAMVSMSGSAEGKITFTTKTPLLGAGEAGVKKGDLVHFSKVLPHTVVVGKHTVEPLDGTGTSFQFMDIAANPPQVYAFDGGGTTAVAHGKVGVQLRAGQPIVVAISTANNLEGYTGKLYLDNVTDQPSLNMKEFTVTTPIAGASFILEGAQAAPLPATAGIAVPDARLPNCTGTAVSQGSNLPPKIDYTKPCKPWRTFPAAEGLYLN